MRSPPLVLALALALAAPGFPVIAQSTVEGAGQAPPETTGPETPKPKPPPPPDAGGVKIPTEKEKLAQYCQSESAKGDPKCAE